MKGYYVYVLLSLIYKYRFLNKQCLLKLVGVFIDSLPKPALFHSRTKHGRDKTHALAAERRPPVMHHEAGSADPGGFGVSEWRRSGPVHRASAWSVAQGWATAHAARPGGTGCGIALNSGRLLPPPFLFHFSFIAAPYLP